MEFFLVWWAVFLLCMKKLLILTPFYESGCLLSQEEGEYTGFTFAESSSLFSNFFNHTAFYLVALSPMFVYAFVYSVSLEKLIYLNLAISILSFSFHFWFQSKVNSNSLSSIQYLFNLQHRIRSIMSIFIKAESIFHQIVLGNETYFRSIKSFKESLDFRFSRQQIKADEEDYTHPEKQILTNLETFVSKNICEVMKNIDRVELLSSDLTVKDGLQKCCASGYSRLPVYKGEDRNKIIGIFRGNQISLLARREKQLNEYMDDICKLSKDMDCYECLRTLQKNKRQLALIYDSDLVIGLVTIEDLVEVFVGKIEDEFDKSGVEKIGEGSYLVHGSFDLIQLEELINKELDKRQVKTLNGYLMKQIRRMPRVGEVFLMEGVEFKIVKTDTKQIQQINLHVLKD
ncbi:hypothetical protein MJH12_09610 [bacterium]|nr:hypothetical protein [bacterium]